MFIEVRKPLLDPLPRVAFRERLAGRVRFCGFCKCLFPRARPRTTRTSRTTESVVGTTADRGRVASSSMATAGGTQGQGSRKTDLDTLHHDCSRRRLCPNPDRSRHLVSRAPFFRPVRRDAGRERVRRRHDCLHRSRDERVVRRPTSAKKSDVHQPEGPSIEGPPVRAAHCRLRGRSRLDDVVGAFFTARNPFEGRSFRPGQLGCRQASGQATLVPAKPQRPLQLLRSSGGPLPDVPQIGRAHV